MDVIGVNPVIQLDCYGTPKIVPFFWFYQFHLPRPSSEAIITTDKVNPEFFFGHYAIA
jgi:hypothetical protein